MMPYQRRILPSPLIWSTACLWSLTCIATQGQEESAKIRDRLLLEWSAVEPRIEALAAQASKLPNYAFDGCVTVFVADDGTEIVWNLWKNRTFKLTDFSKNIASLESLASRQMPFALFARFNIPTEKFDWLDDDRWKTVLSNTNLVASLAQCGKFQGIMLDTEQYGEQVFRIDPSKSEFEVALLRQTVRERGSDWIQAIQNQLSDPVIILTFGYRAASNSGDGRPNIKYELLESFLDGIVESATPTVRIVDGWEYSYGYKTESQFKQSRERFDQIHLNHEYRSKVRLGFGLWLDFDPEKNLWDPLNVERNYFGPNAFAESIAHARTHGHGLVWIYSQRPNSWTNEQLPSEYVRALKDARSLEQTDSAKPDHRPR